MKTSILCKSTSKFLFSLILICSVFLLKTNNVCSQTQTEANKAPLHVISDKMIAQKDASMVEFIGNVKATRLDSIVFADSIKLYFVDDKTDKDSSAQSNVKKIVSTGNVRYTAGERKAFADKAVYTTHDEILVLTGKSPKLITGSSFVTGKKITLFRNQEKVIVESDGTKRVEAFFNPEDNITDKQ
ncbi:LptA/OstA family protein [Desulfobacula sp.]|uniref:LptA/OstA family protein n=1 Tax=Desulfobacula sp. TaxID=2593537 RepID=UPI00260982CD|nr:LptA/OstA family protein [Desulfobacula sp.]